MKQILDLQDQQLAIDVPCKTAAILTRLSFPFERE